MVELTLGADIKEKLFELVLQSVNQGVTVDDQGVARVAIILYPAESSRGAHFLHFTTVAGRVAPIAVGALSSLRVTPSVASKRLPTFDQLKFNLLHVLAIDDEDVNHIVREQLARIADVDGRFCMILWTQTLGYNSIYKVNGCVPCLSPVKTQILMPAMARLAIV